MLDFNTQITEVMEQAAISGLCRDGQLEIALQKARELRPNLSDAKLFELVERLYELSRPRA